MYLHKIYGCHVVCFHKRKYYDPSFMVCVNERRVVRVKKKVDDKMWMECRTTTLRLATSVNSMHLHIL